MGLNRVMRLLESQAGEGELQTGDTRKDVVSAELGARQEQHSSITCSRGLMGRQDRGSLGKLNGTYLPEGSRKFTDPKDQWHSAGRCRTQIRVLDTTTFCRVLPSQRTGSEGGRAPAGFWKIGLCFFSFIFLFSLSLRLQGWSCSACRLIWV